MREKVTSENCIRIMGTWFPSNPDQQAKAWSTVHEWCCQNGLNGYEPELDWQRPGLVKVIEFFEKKDARIASLESQLRGCQEDRDHNINRALELVKDNELKDKEIERLNRIVIDIKNSYSAMMPDNRNDAHEWSMASKNFIAYLIENIKL